MNLALMPRSKFCVSVLLLAAMMLAPAAFAQEVARVQPEMLVGKISRGASHALMLDPELIVELLESGNPDLLLANVQLRRARWENRATLSALLPSVTAQYHVEKFKGGEVIIDQNPVEIDRVTYRPRVFLDYDIHTGLKPYWEWKKTRNQLHRAEHHYDRVWQKKLFDAMSLYFTWLRDRTATTMSQQSLLEATANRKQNEARQANGFGTGLEVSQSAVLEAERQSDLLERKSREVMAGLELAYLLNIPFDQRVEPDTSSISPLTFFNSPDSLESLYETAVQNRPDIQELNATIAEAREALHSTMSDFMPTIQVGSFVGGTGPAMNDLQQTRQAGIRVNLNLLKHLGFSNWSQMQIDRARIEEAALQKEKELAAIKNELSKAFFDFILYRDQLGVMQCKLSSAEQAYFITQERQRLGFGVNLEIIQAKTKVDEARQEYLTSVMNYNTAQLRLMYESGQMSADKVLTAFYTDAETPPKTASLTEQVSNASITQDSPD